VHELHCHRPFAYCGGDTLGGTTPHVARSKNAQEGWSPAEIAGDEAAATPRSAVWSLQTRYHRPQSRPVTKWCGRRADKDEGGKAFDSVGVAGLTGGQLDRNERLFAMQLAGRVCRPKERLHA
jgi:hypothetical protein